MNRRTFASLLGIVGGLARKPGRLALLFGSPGPTQQSPAQEGLTLWDRQPAEMWADAYPIGNGRVGAMIFGGTTTERIQLNEDTLYSDEPGRRDIPLDITGGFDEVHRMLRNREYEEADRYITKHWLGRVWPCYEPMCDLYLDFGYRGFIEDYRRRLDLAEAVCHVRYRLNGAVYTREIFASHPDQVIVARLTSDRPGLLDFKLRLDSIHPTARTTVEDNHCLVIKGQVPGFAIRRTFAYIEEKGDQQKYPEIYDEDGKLRPHAKQVLYGEEIDRLGMFFETRTDVRVTGGTVELHGETLAIRNADEVVVVVSAGTSYNGFDKSPSREGKDPSIRARADLEAASRRSFEDLRLRHVQDYKSLFDRVSLTLGDPTEQSRLPTPERLRRYSTGKDPSLAALYFQFGRYLMISGSRPGTEPLNLQGIWNEEVIPPWAGGYTTNINTQMNYWPAEPANLSECHEPLFRLIKEVAVNGRGVAKETYHRPGWVLHHNTTIWRCAQQVDNLARYSFWPMAGGWLCQHLWDHYRFTGDRDFLAREAYPLMKGAAEFFLEWLIDDGKGHLVTPVGTSPENIFRYTDTDGNKKTSSVSMGPTMDLAVVREVFTNCVHAATTLGIDNEFVTTLEAKLAKLHPFQIGKHGQLQEWIEDFEEPIPGQGHVSHLYPLYPGSQITPRSTPELAKAISVTLRRRQGHGAGTSGWPAAWYINLWARLEKGEEAHSRLEGIFKNRSSASLLNASEGRVFQIDANFGACAGIAEMLLQSHAGEISLLPALPRAWPEGKIHGLRARGRLEVDIVWTGGRLASATLRAHRDAEHRLRVPVGQLIRAIRCGGQTLPHTLAQDGTTALKAQEGRTYELEL